MIILYFPELVSVDWWIIVIWFVGMILSAASFAELAKKDRNGIIYGISFYLIISILGYIAVCYYVDGRGLISIILT